MKELIEKLEKIKHYSNNDNVKDVLTQAIQALSQSNWIKVENRLPTIEEFGDKVLLYRITNNSQKSLSITIHDTNMIKYCENGSMWQPLPTPPNE